MLLLRLTFHGSWSEPYVLDALLSLGFLDGLNTNSQRWLKVLLSIVFGWEMLATTHREHWMGLRMVDDWTLNVRLIGSKLSGSVPLPFTMLDRLLFSGSDNVNCFTFLSHIIFKI